MLPHLRYSASRALLCGRRLPLFATATNKFSSVAESDDGVIKALHRVQSILGHTFQAPRLVLVGDQSSGKTSLLEAIIGKDISHKDNTMATRRPLLLSLLRSDPGTAMTAKFNDGETMTDFEMVKDRIVAENQVFGGEVSPEPIILTISAPHVFDLTLVDLPGFVVAPKLDQPDDLPEQIISLNEPFMHDIGALLCVVNTATADPATSLALRQARKADRDASRSLGVVTKIDLMGKNKEALVNLLENKTFPLGYGRFGVRCRTHQEQLDGVSFAQVEAREKAWCEKEMAAEGEHLRLGVPALRRGLSDLLLERISRELPGIIAQLDERIRQAEHNADFLERLASEPQLATVSSELEILVNQLHPASDARRDFEERLRKRFQDLSSAAFSRARNSNAVVSRFEEAFELTSPSKSTGKSLDDTTRAELRKLSFNPEDFTPVSTYRDLTIYGGESHMDGIVPSKIKDVERRAAADGVICESFLHDLPKNPRRARAAWVRAMQAAVDELLDPDDDNETSIVDEAFSIFNSELDAFADAASEKSGSKDAERARLARLYFGYLMDKIAKRIHEDGLATELQGMIARERRPTADILDLNNALSKASLLHRMKTDNDMTEYRYEDASSGHFPVLSEGFFDEMFTSEGRYGHKIMSVPLFNKDWTAAYFAVASTRVADDLFRITAVRLLERLVFESISFSLNTFSNGAAIKREAGVQSKQLEELRQCRDILKKTHDKFSAQ